MKIDTVTCEQ